jgi:DNA-binding transcriptional LysR family regulator
MATVLRSLDPDQLRAFVSVADSGGFTAAARRLNRTQSAVSMQIRRLEDATGSALFDRGGRRVRITRDGEAFLAYARRLILLNDEALAAVRRGRIEGAVRLGCMDDYATRVLPPLLAQFAADHPAVSVELHTGLTAHMLKQLGQRFDLVLAMHAAGQPLPGGGRGQVVRRERPVWAASRHHAIGDPVPLALSLDGCMFREWAIAAMDAAGRDWRLAYVSPSHAAVEAAVGAGIAVSVFKAGTVARGLRLLRPRDGFKRLPAVDIVLHRAPDLRNGAAARLAEMLGETLRDGSA